MAVAVAVAMKPHSKEYEYSVEVDNVYKETGLMTCFA